MLLCLEFCFFLVCLGHFDVTGKFYVCGAPFVQQVALFTRVWIQLLQTVFNYSLLTANTLVSFFSLKMICKKFRSLKENIDLMLNAKQF